MIHPSRDPDIRNEPHLQPGQFVPDNSEQRAAHELSREASGTSDAERVEHSVWDEPSLSPDLAGVPDAQQLTYARWLDQCQQQTSWFNSWLAVLWVALAAGPWGILGALLQSVHGTFALPALIIFGPVTEEITKIAVVLWVVEKRPFWFRSMWQILLCAASGGMVFAIVENLIYLQIYISEPTPEIVHWRWSACVGLHIVCSLTAGMGLVRIWNDAMHHRHRPQLSRGVPWLITAMAGHAIYNATVTFAQIVN